MNIVLATDDNYTQHCAVTMMSIIKHNSNVSFFILTEGLSEISLTKLNNVIQGSSSKISIIIVKSDYVSDFPMPDTQKKHISIATYYRLFIERLLPKSIDKVIYLDCDIVIRKNLTELWEICINKYAMAVVYQNNEWALNNNSYNRLNIDPQRGYFNAGVLLINVNYWRVKAVTQRLFNFIRNNPGKIRSHDQDVLNAVLSNEVLGISCTYNLLSSFLSKNLSTYSFPEIVNYHEKIDAVKIDPVVVHFVSVPKPWDYGCNNPFRDDYFKYLKYTPWSNFRVKFSLTSFYKFVLFPYLNKYRKAILKK